MEVFPLRPSAYLCVLCVNGPFQRRGPQRYAEAAEKQIRFATFVQSRAWYFVLCAWRLLLSTL